jgi:hypothetical protein
VSALAVAIGGISDIADTHYVKTRAMVVQQMFDDMDDAGRFNDNTHRAHLTVLVSEILRSRWWLPACRIAAVAEGCAVTALTHNLALLIAIGGAFSVVRAGGFSALGPISCRTADVRQAA